LTDELDSSRRLPEMEGGWDEFFDDTYLRTYVPGLETTAEEEAGAAVDLAEVESGAAILDVPCGFGRHAIALALAGFRVTGIDRSDIQLAEAQRRSEGAEWPRFVRGDYRDLPFADATFDAVLCLFTSLGYLDRAGDIGVLREVRRVLHAHAPAIIETMHRDRLARIFEPRRWERLPDGTLFLQERSFDAVAGTAATEHVIVTPDGERIVRRFVHRVYTATEWVAMLSEAGFEEIECFGGWTRDPVSSAARLVVRAR
jgi:SAM-dependent methyltransferase